MVAPIIAVGQHFDSIEGLVDLSFCTWELAPNSINDFSPVPMTPDAGPSGDGG